MSDFFAWFYPGDATAIGAAVVFLQITVAIALAVVTAHALAKRGAAPRHAIWLAALGCVLVSPVLVVLTGRMGLVLVRIELPKSAPVVEAAADGPQVEVLPAPASEPPHREREAETPSVAPNPIAATKPILTDYRSANGTTEAKAVAVAPTNPWRAVIGALFLAWAVGSAFLLLRLLHGCRLLARLRRAARPLDARRYAGVLDSIASLLRITTLPPIRTSPLVHGPAAGGVLWPCVLLPERLRNSLDDRQLRDVLIHECAHLLRRDPLVGLLQRLAEALFWPHPLVHYLNRRLARAREEVCDDYVLQAGDARAYARTLLTLAEGGVCRPVGAAGLFDPNWKLEDRVAGLLDPRRTPMKRLQPWTIVGFTAVLLAACTAGAAIRAGGEPAKKDKSDTKKPKEAVVAADVSKAVIEGVVVDEAGKPVAGAVVRVASLPSPDTTPARTAADGSFRLVAGKEFPQIGLVTASIEDGARQGIYENSLRRLSPMPPVRIVVKPARPMAVRVTDDAKAPIKGAEVGVLENGLLLAKAETDARGLVSLRLPRDADIHQVVALKPGSGCDYYENYRARLTDARVEPPAEVALTLDGARTFRVRVVDSANHALAGVDVALGSVRKKGKITYVNFSYGPALKYVRARTDRDGLASFEWIPTDVPYPVNAFASMKQYRQLVVLRLFHDVPISGKVTLPDGKPAADVLVQLEGRGDTLFHHRKEVRTQADGSYSLLASPNLSYIIGVTDEHWAAPSKTGIAVKEGEPRTDLDFRLGKGTVLRGKVTTGPHDHAAAKKRIEVVEEGVELPANLGGDGTKHEQLDRSTETDATGRYSIRVGPGRYLLANNEALRHRKEITVKSEETVEMDLKIDALNRGVLSGLVLAGGLDGKPVGEAFIKGESEVQGEFNGGSFEHETDEQGRFKVERERVKASVYARNPAGTLATIVTVGEDDDNTTILLSDAGQIKGRLIDASGKPVADMRVDWFLHMGPLDKANPRASLGATTDDAGRFTLLGVVPGAECQISVVPGNRIQHLKNLPMTKVETLDIGDLVCDPNG
jgi:beta-lactamase regulating signal transducer with metallopeptidase domain